MKTRRGFTVIETILSMAFLSVLLIAIAFVIIHVGNIYQKGLTIRTVNSVGQELIDDFSRSINASPVKDIKSLCRETIGVGNNTSACAIDGAYRYIYQQNYANAKILGQTKRVPTSGVFCAGRYSYIWNTGYVLGNYGDDAGSRGTLQNSKARLTYSVDGGGSGTKTDFRLLRMRDDDGDLCYNHANGYNISTSNNYNADGIESEPIELIEQSEYNVAIYDLVIFRPTQHELTLHALFSGTFILATIDGGVDITANGDYCKDAPDNLNTDFNYCMVNKFNFAMRATGELTDAEKQLTK